MFVYVSEIIYVASLALIKASLVTMYLRIFWAYVPFKYVCYGALLFILLPSAAIIILTILSCQPIAYFWDRDIPNGKCLDVSALAYANSGFAVAQDALLIMLPIFMLWGLNMSRKKKVFIGMMFAVGSIGLLATIIRLRTLSVFGSLRDPTFDYILVVYWTTIELAAGMIASCMPSIRILLERFFKVFHLSTNRSLGSGRPIKLERQRRPTVEVIDPLQSPASIFKQDMWDVSSQKGLVIARSDLESGVDSPIKMTRYDHDVA
ncbi:hypothetical protein N0V93_002269 [Gnomoniopsis smithogilvyi]|uniref:Rhodopsin domain-containing protein n=1 Tax=Gnomoniopsis smithogilvyi TaxID=1191159 RepID=A0A9W8YUZ9_9PEZI|nr:hypothetical protein N0V93_002269 [Gnomoniopsis smithogilvyi]